MGPMNVPARRTTGLSGLDAQLGGGFLPGSAHVLIGEPMNAFELFGYHFAAGGTTLGNVRFLTTDRTPAEIQAGVTRVGGAVDKLQVGQLPHKNSWAVPDIKQGFRYIIDDASSWSMAAGFDVVMARLQQLREQAHQVETDLLITLTSGLLDKGQETQIKRWADGILELGFDRQGFGLYPFLKVTKMRGVPESSRFILFKETDAGLFMESTRRVF